MTFITELAWRSVIIGAGATVVIDLWAALLRRMGVPSLNMAFLGRWVGHLPEGRFFHENIAKSPAVRGEALLGWLSHYAIGVSFAALLLALFGLDWADAPTLGPALVVGGGTLPAPLLVLQPALGAGVASSKTPRPVFNTLKSVTTHVMFGLGLFLAAWVASRLVSALGGGS